MESTELTVTEKSEFGSGFAYCLGLFLCHDERRIQYKELEGERTIDIWPMMWFSGAADHLFEMHIPDQLDDYNKARAAAFRSACIHWRMEVCAWEDVEWAINEAKALLLAWDKACGLPAIKARHE